MAHKLQIAEKEARLMAHRCPVYAPGKLEPDSVRKATSSGQTSAACGERWLAARSALRSAGLDPLPVN